MSNFTGIATRLYRSHNLMIYVTIIM